MAAASSVRSVTPSSQFKAMRAGTFDRPPSFVGSHGDTFDTWITPSKGATMANKDKGGSKSSKTAASKSLKEKRQAKKAKANRSGASSMGASTNR
jgi:hypothetical protein